MGLFSNHYTKPGPGIPKEATPKKGLALFWDVLTREVFELVKLNLLYLLFCIPVVTIPAATTAMSRILLSMIRDQNHFLAHDFWNAFRENFKSATIAGIPLYLMLALSCYGLYFYGMAAAASPVYSLPFVLTLLVFLLLCGAALYLFPMLALIDLPLGQTVKDSVYLIFLRLPHNLLTMLICGILLFLTIGFFPFTLIYVLIIGFAFYHLITCFCAYSGIRKYVIQEDGENNP